MESAQAANPPRRSRPTAPDAGSGRLDLWVATALIVVGILARLPRLGESLWYDEIAAWRDYGARGAVFIVTTYRDPANHIAHTLATAFSARLENVVGQEAALRVPALFFSLASIGVLYGLAREVAGRRIAIVAGLLAAVGPVSILEGVEARGYSMMICFAAAATTQWLVAARTGRLRSWVLYAILCGLGVWAHMTTVFVPAGHALWLLVRVLRRRDWPLLGLGSVGLALSAALTVILYAPVLDDLLEIGGLFTTSSGAAPSPFGAEGLHALLQLGGSWAWWAAVPGLLLAALGLLTADGRQREAVGLSLLGLPLMVLVVLAAGSWMYARFTLFALPGAVLAIALGLDTLWRRHRGAAIAVLVGLLVVYAVDLVTRPSKQPLREAARFIQATDPGARVLVIGLAHRVMDAYAGTLDLHHSLRHGSDLSVRIDEVKPGWIIVIYPRSVPRDRYELLRQRGFTPAIRFDGWVDWNNGDVEVWGLTPAMGFD